MQVANSTDVTAVAEVVRRMLQRRHNDVTDFEISVPELLLKQEQRTKTIFNIVLGAIASISLVVGGIGIMNIMLASILERIKEIGVRRAMGATQGEILAQFLAEAVMISVAGGVAGIILGVVFASGIERLAHIRTIVSPLSVIAGVRRVGRGRTRVRHRSRVERREAGPDRLPPLRIASRTLVAACRRGSSEGIACELSLLLALLLFPLPAVAPSRPARRR